jgi:hypothetical protein
MKRSTMGSASGESLATCAFGTGAAAFQRATLCVGLAIVCAILGASIDPAAAHAAEPGGHITVARDVPAHGAFQRGDAGQPADIATAREDIVLTNTNTIARTPRPMSDAALGNVAAQTGSRSELAKQMGGSIATFGMPASGSSFGQGLMTSPTHPAQAIGTAVSGSTSSIGAAMSGLAVLK